MNIMGVKNVMGQMKAVVSDTLIESIQEVLYDYLTICVISGGIALISFKTASFP